MSSMVFPSSLAGGITGSVLAALLVIASAWDVKTRRIPNWLVVIVAVGGLAASVLAPWTTHVTVSAGLLGLVVGLVIWLPFYFVGWLGAGDVKLFAAGGAWLGPSLVLQAAVVAAMAGGLIALVSLGLTRSVGRHTRRAIPYGVALSVGIFVTAWLHSNGPEVLHALR